MRKNLDDVGEPIKGVTQFGRRTVVEKVYPYFVQLLVASLALKMDFEVQSDFCLPT